MCTAAIYKTDCFYFGRNLDLDFHYHEEVTITPRAFPFHFRNGKTLENHYAMIGMATVEKDYPLYYEATNEMGLSLAGLNFPGNAVYYPWEEGKDNIAPFELIPWILGQCANTNQALEKLDSLNLWNVSFSEDFPASPLHWMLADRDNCIVFEAMTDGLKIHENPAGVLTNNPPFDFHMYNLARYMHVTAAAPENRFSEKLQLKPFSIGMGSIGLPGDMSSPSRFVKAAFTRLNSNSGSGELESVSQFFHILGSVAQQRGLTQTGKDRFEYTLYSSCCSADKGIYYYTTYENSQITGVSMHHVNLESNQLFRYPLVLEQQIRMEN